MSFVRDLAMILVSMGAGWILGRIDRETMKDTKGKQDVSEGGK